MSKLNPKGKDQSQTGVSYNGNVQAVKKEAQQLFEIVVATMYGRDGYYESNDARVVRLKRAVDACVKKGLLDFIANVIYKGRTDFKMRTMPVVLTVHFAESLRENNVTYNNLRNVVADVIQRADQITDMYSYALSVFGSKNKIPLAIRKGVADAFNKFSEYQFGKYKSGGQVKMTDVMRIVHPKAKDDAQAVVFDKIMNEARPDDKKTDVGPLEVPYTWEVELSQVGKVVAAQAKDAGIEKDTVKYIKMLEDAKREKWTELVTSGKLGYMALLRNLRNIIDAKIDEKVYRDHVLKVLSDENNVAKSKQLPFRFISAQEAVSDTKTINALNKALEHSLSNVPQLGENVWIIMDVSGSMQGGWGSSRNKMSPIRQASLFSAALLKANQDATNVKLTIFSDNAKHLRINPADSFETIMKTIEKSIYGGGTNLKAALDLKSSLGFEPDTVILLSDMQVDAFYGYGDFYHMRSSGNIAKMFDKNALLLAFNLEAYETTPVGELHGWYQLSGFSETIFDMVPAMRGSKSIVQQLNVPYINAR